MNNLRRLPLQEKFERFPARVRASLIHLSLSALVAATFGCVVFFVWYPAPYGAASGVLPIFFLLVGVDVTLGPFITLIIFNTKKKSLRFDMAVIVVIQLVALGYGMRSVFSERPVFIVFNVDRFDVVPANDIEAASLQRARDPQFRTLPWTGPIVVGASIPSDREQRNALLFSSAQGGPDLPQLPEYYRPLSDVAEDIKSRLKPVSELRSRNAQASSGQLRKLEPYEKGGASFGYVPLRGKSKDFTVIMDHQTGKIVDILRLDPW
jgi:hypothetical protein